MQLAQRGRSANVLGGGGAGVVGIFIILLLYIFLSLSVLYYTTLCGDGTFRQLPLFPKIIYKYKSQYAYRHATYIL